MNKPFFSFFGEPVPGRKAPLVNVYDYAMTESQYAELGYFYGQYRLLRQTDVLNYAYSNIALSDGSRVKFTSVGDLDILDVWPVRPEAEDDQTAGIGFLMTDLNGMPVEGLRRSDGYGSYEPAPMLLQRGPQGWWAKRLPALRGGHLLHVSSARGYWASANADGVLAYQHNMTLKALRQASALCPPFVVDTSQGKLLCHAAVSGNKVKLWMGAWGVTPGLDGGSPRDPQDFIGPLYFELDAGTPLCVDRSAAVSPDGSQLLVVAQDERQMAAVDVSAGDARLALRDPGLNSTVRQVNGGRKTVTATTKRLPNAYQQPWPQQYFLHLDLEQKTATSYEPFEATKIETFLDHPLFRKGGELVLCQRTVERHWRYEGALGSVWRAKPATEQTRSAGTNWAVTFVIGDTTDNEETYGFSKDTRIDLAGYTFQQQLVSYELFVRTTQGNSYTWVPPHQETSTGPLIPAAKVYTSDPNAATVYSGTIEHTERKLLAHDADLGLVVYAELSIKLRLDGELTGGYASDETALRLVVVRGGAEVMNSLIAPVRRGVVAGTLPSDPMRYFYGTATGSATSYVARSVFGETVCPLAQVGSTSVYQGSIYDITSPDGTTTTAGWSLTQALATQASISYEADIETVNNLLREVGLAYGPGVVGGNRVTNPQDAKASWVGHFLDGTYVRNRLFYNTAWPNGGGTYVEGSAPVTWRDYTTATQYGLPISVSESYFDTPLVTVNYDPVAHPTPPLDLVTAHSAKDPITGGVLVQVDFDGPSLAAGTSRASWTLLADDKGVRPLQSVLNVPAGQALRLVNDSSNSLVSV